MPGKGWPRPPWRRACPWRGVPGPCVQWGGRGGGIDTVWRCEHRGSGTGGWRGDVCSHIDHLMTLLAQCLSHYTQEE